MGPAQDVDQWTDSPWTASRWVAPLLAQQPLLEGLSWRLIGLVLLLWLPFSPLAVMNLVRTANWGSTLYWVLGFVLDGLLVLLLGIVLTNLRLRGLPRPVALAVAVLLGCTLASFLVQLPWAFGFPARDEPTTGSFFGDVLWLARRAALPWGFTAAAWYFMQRISERTATLRDSELARHQLEAQIVEARLQVMQAQTEPHFLFNTLAHVKRLYRTDPVLGRTMLDHYCDYLRAALPQMRGNGSTLGRELDLACAYLDVQKIRMGKRLAIGIDVPADMRDLPFPSMMLLSVVENAIKHGLSPLPDGGEITISAKVREGSLRLVIADTGRGFSATEGAGIGLSNIRARLSSLYGSAAGLILMPNPPRGIVATIALPLDAMPDGSTRLADAGAGVDRTSVARARPK